MLKRLILVALATASVPAIAAPVIWNDLEIGMTKEQVKQRYPTMRLPIGGDCEVKIYPSFKNNALRIVTLGAFPTPKDGLGGRDRCAELVRSGLVQKYGTPAGSLLGRGDTYRDSHYTIYEYWQQDTLIITFGVDKIGGVGSVTYRYSSTDDRQVDSSKL